MKKSIAIILCILLIFTAGCAKNKTENTESPTETVVETLEPTSIQIQTEPTETEPPVPQTISGTVLADHTDVVLMTVDRDSVVDVVSEFDEDYYVVKTELGYGLIEKRLVRMNDAVSYEQWNGYARSGAKFYTNYHLLSDGLQELSMNTQMIVLDTLGEVFVVQIDEVIGYMRESDISRSYIQYTPENGSSGGEDGGDISLGYMSEITSLSTFIPQSGEVSGSATVLANATEIILGWYDRGETANIVNETGFAEEKNGYVTVYLDGLYGYVWQALIRLEGSEPYSEWDGYAYHQASVYDNYYLMGDPVKQLATNTVVCVLHDLGDCYVVTIDGDFGYMDKAQVSTTKIVYNGSNNNGGGEWSDPVL